MIRIPFLVLVPAALAAQQPQAQPADLIVTNARIYTVDDARPMAAAMAVRGGRVQFVGDAREAADSVDRGGQQRFADLPAGELLLLQQNDAVSSHRDQRRQGRSARPAAHDDNIGLFIHVFSAHPRSPVLLRMLGIRSQHCRVQEGSPPRTRISDEVG